MVLAQVLFFLALHRRAAVAVAHMLLVHQPVVLAAALPTTLLLQAQRVIPRQHLLLKEIVVVAQVHTPAALPVAAV